MPPLFVNVRPSIPTMDAKATESRKIPSFNVNHQ